MYATAIKKPGPMNCAYFVNICRIRVARWLRMPKNVVLPDLRRWTLAGVVESGVRPCAELADLLVSCIFASSRHLSSIVSKFSEADSSSRSLKLEIPLRSARVVRSAVRAGGVWFQVGCFSVWSFREGQFIINACVGDLQKSQGNRERNFVNKPQSCGHRDVAHKLGKGGAAVTSDGQAAVHDFSRSRMGDILRPDPG
jgi:hypothetical protein